MASLARESLRGVPLRFSLLGYTALAGSSSTPTNNFFPSTSPTESMHLRCRRRYLADVVEARSTARARALQASVESVFASGEL